MMNLPNSILGFELRANCNMHRAASASYAASHVVTVDDEDNDVDMDRPPMPPRLSLRERIVQHECRAQNLLKGLGGNRDFVNAIDPCDSDPHVDLASDVSDDELDDDAEDDDDWYRPRDICPPLTDHEMDEMIEECGVDINDDDELLRRGRQRTVLQTWEDRGWEEVEATQAHLGEFERLYGGASGPSREVSELVEDPLQLFWFFFPKALLRHIAIESSRYASQRVVDRAQEIRDKQASAAQHTHRVTVQPLELIVEQLRRRQEFQPHEYAHLFGLMLAHVLVTRPVFSNHWATTSNGLVPKGTFGKIMSNQRFDELLTNMHFSDNNDPRARADRVWKLRPLIDVLQDTFQRGYEPEAELRFGEGLLPQRMQERGPRKFERNLPLKSDAKMFLTHCAKSSYCLRFDLYCGKKQVPEDDSNYPLIDEACGPGAVLRSLLSVVPRERNAFHRVVTDRYFTSIPLALELLRHKILITGAMQPSRIGFPSVIKPPQLDEDAGQRLPRGVIKTAVSTLVPGMVATCVWGRRPLHVLATGAISQDRDLTTRVVSGPSVVEQLRRSSRGASHFELLSSELSIQRLFKCKKYYQSIALGLLDCALANAYIVHREYCTRWGRNVTDQVDFLRILHTQLLEVTARDMEIETLNRSSPSIVVPDTYIPRQVSPGLPSAPPPQLPPRYAPTAILASPSPAAPPVNRPAQPRSAPQASSRAQPPPTQSLPQAVQPPPPAEPTNPHVAVATDDFQVTEFGRKRMARGCKVCSGLAKPGSRGANTKWICAECSKHHDGDVHLCQLMRHESNGRSKSCFAIWHEDWDCGRSLPSHVKRVRYRKPPAKRQRVSSPSPSRMDSTEHQCTSEAHQVDSTQLQ